MSDPALAEQLIDVLRLACSMSWAVLASSATRPGSRSTLNRTVGIASASAAAAGQSPIRSARPTA